MWANAGPVLQVASEKVQVKNLRIEVTGTEAAGEADVALPLHFLDKAPTPGCKRFTSFSKSNIHAKAAAEGLQAALIACATHTGDNLTGEGDGDDEVLIVDFSKVPADIQKIAITVTIYDAQVRGQNFGQVSNGPKHPNQNPYRRRNGWYPNPNQSAPYSYFCPGSLFGP